MAKYEIVMPKMGESIIEATITKWLLKEGDSVQEDDAIVEVATDKVDSEIPSPVDGTVKELFYKEGDVVPIGSVIAILEIEGEDSETETENHEKDHQNISGSSTGDNDNTGAEHAGASHSGEVHDRGVEAPADDRFYSPLVKNIAKKEGISSSELSTIKGTGAGNRVTKNDMLNYLENRGVSNQKEVAAPAQVQVTQPAAPKPAAPAQPSVPVQQGDKVFEMDRMRKLIADHMVMSKQVSPHVTMFIDIDVTNIVKWRNKVKQEFLSREGEKITFTPIFIEAVAKVLKQYPGINASVDGQNIIHRGRINIGMATALPDGNLIVPVIKDADQKNLLGITKSVNDLANRARNKKLEADEISGGTFSVTNFGSFDSITGTPIINQPQVAILGIGGIRKKPAVIETSEGDMIAIRHITIFSMAFDHRIVDGALGGKFLQSLKKELESFDVNQKI